MSTRRGITVDGEYLCPRCGRGLVTGTVYPTCAGVKDEANRVPAHEVWCRDSLYSPDLQLCRRCATESETDHV